MRNIISCSATAIAALVVAAPAYAQPASEAEQYNFTVSDGRLSDVVAEIASQARASISVEKGAGADTKVSGLNGVYTLQAALGKVLAQSEYELETGPNHTFRIVRRSGETDIVVTARRRDFARTDSSLLTRTDTPLRQTPGTIDSVTKEVLKSQNAISVYEALRNIPGVTFSTSNGANSVVVGQVESSLTYVNGLQASRLAGNPPVTDIEAIEVLKGPASILQGATIAGGVVNFVPKRADGLHGGEVTLGGGSGSEILATADVGGAILPDDGLFWRVSAMGQYAKHVPNGNNDPHQYVINPMVGYRGDGVKFDATFQYYDKRTPSLLLAAYIPATDSFQDYGARINRDTGIDVESKRGSYNLEVNLVSSESFSLTLRNQGLYQEVRRAAQGVFPVIYDFMGFGAQVLSVSNQDRDKQLSGYVDLYAKFATGSIDHQLIAAVDLMHSDTNRAIAQGFGSSTDVNPFPPTPIPTMERASLTETRQTGLVLQDQMTLGSVHALVGLRQTFYKTRPFTRNASGDLIPSTAIAEADKFSFNGGLVYDISPAVSVYASYSNGFSAPQADLLTVDGSILPPQVRTQYEAGLKSGLFDDRVTLNLSAYKFSTDNSVEPDPTNPLRYRSGPGLKGSGGEVSLAGSLTSTLKVLAGYTYSESKKPTKTPVTAIPNHVANLWAIQTFAVGAGQSIDLGLGGNYSSGFNAQDFFDGKYYKVDRDNISVNGSLAYTFGEATLNVVVNNIFDRRNYQPSAQVSAIQLDTPRSVRATLRVRF